MKKTVAGFMVGLSLAVGALACGAAEEPEATSDDDLKGTVCVRAWVCQKEGGCGARKIQGGTNGHNPEPDFSFSYKRIPKGGKLTPTSCGSCAGTPGVAEYLVVSNGPSLQYNYKAFEFDHPYISCTGGLKPRSME
ncbi:MAG: hypothetical protein U0174_15595 [Polyangiaceae bacterium]